MNEILAVFDIHAAKTAGFVFAAIVLGIWGLCLFIPRS